MKNSFKKALALYVKKWNDSGRVTRSFAKEYNAHFEKMTGQPSKMIPQTITRFLAGESEMREGTMISISEFMNCYPLYGVTLTLSKSQIKDLKVEVSILDVKISEADKSEFGYNYMIKKRADLIELIDSKEINLV